VHIYIPELSFIGEEVVDVCLSVCLSLTCVVDVIVDDVVGFVGPEVIGCSI
jgi:hypothetical protein